MHLRIFFHSKGNKTYAAKATRPTLESHSEHQQDDRGQLSDLVVAILASQVYCPAT